MGDNESTDVLIAGGGPAGLATGISLAQRGRKVVLLERSGYDATRVGEHLAPEAIPLLARLGADGILTDPRHLRCSCVTSAWGSPEWNSNDYLRGPYDDGFNLSRPAFDESLAVVAERAGVRVLRRSALISQQLEETCWNIRYARDSQPESIRVNFVVDASGRSSSLGKSLGGRRIIVDRLIGIAAFCEVPRPNPDQSVFIEAQRDGWWYTTTLADHRVIAIFMTDSDLFQSAGEPPDKFWTRMLNGTRLMESGLRASHIVDCVVRSAHSGRLDPACGPGWLAVGDTALSFDPLSSMGISKGLDQGIRAAAAIHAYLAGDTGQLDQYQHHIRSAFDEYLTIRARYYRAERRWPNAELWRRRHQQLPSEVELTLDPAQIVCAVPGAPVRDRRRSFGEVTPAIDDALMVELARDPLPAHQLAARFKAACAQRHSDREIILAIQMLVDAGVLRVNESTRP